MALMIEPVYSLGFESTTDIQTENGYTFFGGYASGGYWQVARRSVSGGLVEYGFGPYTSLLDAWTNRATLAYSALPTLGQQALLGAYMHLKSDTGVFSDAGTTPATDTDAVQEWHDANGNGRKVQNAGATKPVYEVVSPLNSLPAISFSGGQFLESDLAASSWNFLHNGSGATVFVVARQPSANPEALETILATFNVATANIGYGLFFEDRAAASADETARVIVARGTSGTPSSGMQTADNQTPMLTTHVISHRIASVPPDGNQSDIRVNSSYLIGEPLDAPASAGNAAGTARIGVSTADTFPLAGQIAEIAIFDSALPESTMAIIQSHLSTKYGTV